MSNGGLSLSCSSTSSGVACAGPIRAVTSTRFWLDIVGHTLEQLQQVFGFFLRAGEGMLAATIGDQQHAQRLAERAAEARAEAPARYAVAG